jgi:hypothetical protein
MPMATAISMKMALKLALQCKRHHTHHDYMAVPIVKVVLIMTAKIPILTKIPSISTKVQPIVKIQNYLVVIIK